MLVQSKYAHAVCLLQDACTSSRLCLEHSKMQRCNAGQGNMKPVMSSVLLLWSVGIGGEQRQREMQGSLQYRL